MLERRMEPLYEQADLHHRAAVLLQEEYLVVLVGPEMNRQTKDEQLAED